MLSLMEGVSQCLSITEPSPTGEAKMGTPFFKDYLKYVLKNKLVLIPGAVADEGHWADHFLCGEIEDDELPWDLDQEDW